MTWELLDFKMLSQQEKIAYSYTQQRYIEENVYNMKCSFSLYEITGLSDPALVAMVTPTADIFIHCTALHSIDNFSHRSSHSLSFHFYPDHSFFFSLFIMWSVGSG